MNTQKTYKLTDLISNGSNARQNIDSLVVVSDGKYKKGTLLDANTIASEYLSKEEANLSEDYVTAEDVDNKIKEIIGTATEDFDTLGEIADFLKENKDAIDSLDDLLKGKASLEDINRLIEQIDSKQPKGDYATNANVSERLKDYLTKGEAANTYQPKGNYLTQHQDISHLAVKKDVDKAINDLAEYAEDTYAKQEGYYPELVAGTAANLEGKNDIVNAYMYRPTSGVYDVDSGVVSILSIQGNAVAWNQLVKNGNFADDEGWIANSSTSINTKNNEIAITSNVHAGGCYVRKTITNLVSNHIYLATCLQKGGNKSSTNRLTITLLGTNYSNNFNYSSNYTRCSVIGQCGNSSNNNFIYLYNNNVEPDEIQYYKNVQLFDLTLIYGAGNEPTTPEQFEVDYQRWFGKTLEYEEYDEGSIRTVLATGIKTVGFNLYNGADKYDSIKNLSKEFLFKNDINYKGDIYVNLDYKYDGYVNNNTLLSLKATYEDNTYNVTLIGGYNQQNGHYTNKITSKDTSIKYLEFFYTGTETERKVSISNICINFSWSGKRDGDYEPYWEETKALPITELTSNGEKIFPDGLKRAGNAYDEIFVENGVTKAVKRVVSVDLGTIAKYDYWSIGGKQLFVLGFNEITDAKDGLVLCSKYYSVNNSNALKDKSVCTGYANSIYSPCIMIYDTSYTDTTTFKQSLQGTILYYELAEPITYTIDNFQLPLAYKVDDFGTEQVISPENSVAPVIVARYGVNAVDTIRRLPKNYISTTSADEFISTINSTTYNNISKSWDDLKNCYVFNNLPEDIYVTHDNIDIITTKIKNEIPTKLSSLENDTQYVNNSQINEKVSTAVSNLVNKTPQYIETLDSLNNRINQDQDQIVTIIEEINDAKFALFIDLWNNACGSYGKYNAETDHFELNGLTDITYDEALIIYNQTKISTNYNYGRLGVINDGIYTNNRKQWARTNLPRITCSNGNGDRNEKWDYFCYKNSVIEVINVDTVRFLTTDSRISPSKECVFFISNCENLTEVIGIISLYNTGNNTFSCIGNLPKLEKIKLYNIRNGQTVNISTLPKINYDSIKYIIDNKWYIDNVKESSIITVHQDIYQALTGNATYPFNGGTQEEWTQLLQDAPEKNITFATA